MSRAARKTAQSDLSDFYLLHDEALDNVADLYIVEFFDLHAALIAAGDFLNVVLEAAQRRKLALVDLLKKLIQNI